jgi:hypothetical protein
MLIFFQFLDIKPWIRIGSGSVFGLNCWIRIPDPYHMNTEPKNWSTGYGQHKELLSCKMIGILEITANPLFI